MESNWKRDLPLRLRDLPYHVSEKIKLQLGERVGTHKNWVDFANDVFTEEHNLSIGSIDEFWAHWRVRENGTTSLLFHLCQKYHRFDILEAFYPDAEMQEKKAEGYSKCVNHDKPREKESYFAPFNSTKPIVSVIVPFYNEEWGPLIKTLRSLYDSSLKCSEFEFTYLLIQDGWKNSHLSMREGLKKLYPDLKSLWDDLEDKNKHVNGPATFIFDTGIPTRCLLPKRKKDSKPPVYDLDVLEEIPMNITLIVKKDNRKKHNSHQWFFGRGGYCSSIGPKFCFATDCSTLFSVDCIAKLIEIMNDEENCAVSTGRQVVMTAEQQGCQDSLIEYVYRMAQCYDFESSFSSFMGAFATFGFLPVIPGPCGLYRWKIMNGDPLDWYFEIVNKPAEDCGIILANLKIAEDRILSYSAVIKAPMETTMKISPDAEFYFEAETDLEKFVKQRRRWINGTFAGYIYMFLERQLIFESKMNWWRKLSVMFLIMCQICLYAIVAITPAVFLAVLYSVMTWVFPAMQYSPSLALIIWLAFFVLFVYFVLKHYQDNFVAWLFYIHMFLGMLTMLLSPIAMIWYLVTSWKGDPITISIIAITLGTSVGPLIISFHRPSSTLRLLKSIVPFYLFLPTLVAWFGAYSVSRFSDISWGNRPDSGQPNIVPRKALNHAQTYMAIVLMINLFILLLYVLKSDSQIFLLVLAIILCAFSAVQMALSLIYFVFNFLFGKFFIGVVALLIGFLMRKVYGLTPKNYKEINPSNDFRGFQWKSVRSALLLTTIHFATNFTYQIIFLTIPYKLDINRINADISNTFISTAESLGYPAIGFISLVIGIIGDKYESPIVFKGITVFGTIFYVATIVVCEIGFFYSSFDKYTLVLVESYLQVVGLNISAAASFVIFLRYTEPPDLLLFTAIKSLLGAIANFFPSISIGFYLIQNKINPYVFLILNCVTATLFVLSTILLLLGSKGEPVLRRIDSVNAKNRNTRVAKIIASYFFGSICLSPFQFGLFTYFTQVGSNNVLFWEILALGVQQGIVIILGFVVMFTRCRTFIKEITSVLVLTSLTQILFVVPQLGTNTNVGFVLVAFSGFYATIHGIFLPFFFAREVLEDISHTGFWVASLNVTLVIAQMIGISLTYGILHVLQMYQVFGIVGVFGILSVVSTWGIPSVELQTQNEDFRIIGQEEDIRIIEQEEEDFRLIGKEEEEFPLIGKEKKLLTINEEEYLLNRKEVRTYSSMER